MRKVMRCLAVAATVGLLALGSVVRADEEKVPLNKLPKAVQDGVKARFPDAKVSGASKEVEEGKTVFEISLESKGQKIDATFNTEGKLLGLEKQIDAKKLPKPVVAALEGKYPKATYQLVEEIIKVEKDKETFAHYEVLLVTADKKKFEVCVAKDGKIVKEESKDKKKD